MLGVTLLAGGCRVSIGEGDERPVGTPPKNETTEPQPTEGSETGTLPPANGEATDYPTSNLGFRVGKNMPNLSFTGYAPNAKKRGTVSLSSVHDPDGPSGKLIALVITTGWDDYGPLTLESLEGASAEIVPFTVFVDGVTPETDVTMDFLDAAHEKFPAAAVAVDPKAASFTKIEELSVPFIIFIDARTMKIRGMGAGALLTPQDVDKAVAGLQ